MRVSISTVKRVWAYWLTYHEYIPLKKRGRPEGEGLSMNERETIKRAKGKYKLGARRLEKVIERDCGIRIPHNRIHQHLLKEGMAKE